MTTFCVRVFAAACGQNKHGLCTEHRLSAVTLDIIHESMKARPPLCVPANLTPCQIKTPSLPIMPFDSPLPLKRIQSALYSPYVRSQILSQKSPTQYFLSFLISEKNSRSWKPIYSSFNSLLYTHTHAHITFMLTQYMVLYSQYKAWRQVLGLAFWKKRAQLL